MPTWLIVALAVAYVLIGLPVVAGTTIWSPRWRKALVLTVFLPSAVLYVIAVFVALTMNAWSCSRQ